MDDIKEGAEAVDPADVEYNEGVVDAKSRGGPLYKGRNEESASGQEEIGGRSEKGVTFVPGYLAIFGENKSACQVEKRLNVDGDSYADTCDIWVRVYAGL